MKTNFLLNNLQRDARGMSYSNANRCSCHPETCNCKRITYKELNECSKKNKKKSKQELKIVWNKWKKRLDIMKENRAAELELMTDVQSRLNDEMITYVAQILSDFNKLINN